MDRHGDFTARFSNQPTQKNNLVNFHLFGFIKKLKRCYGPFIKDIPRSQENGGRGVVQCKHFADKGFNFECFCWTSFMNGLLSTITLA